MINFEELAAFLAEHFPQGNQYGELVELGDGWARMRLSVADQHLRPGGTVSGPTMMGLADVAVYAALLSRIGPQPMAVTASLNINFLRRPKSGADILAYAKMLKVGKRLAVGEAYITSDGDEEPMAHATMTYAIPEPANA